MKEINNKLLAIYYCIYAVFAVGIVCAHIFNPSFVKLYGTERLVAEYIELGLMLVLIPAAIGVTNSKLKRQGDLDYYFKWNLFQMLMIAFTGIVAIVVYALIPLNGRLDVTEDVNPTMFQSLKNLFPMFIIFIALIFCKPTKYKIQHYFS